MRKIKRATDSENQVRYDVEQKAGLQSHGDLF